MEADPAAVIERVAAAHPGGRVSGIDAPTTARATYLAYVVTGDRFQTILLDPATLSILGELPERSVVRLLQNLHFELLGGRTGRKVNGGGAMLLLLLALTGFVSSWPRWSGARGRRPGDTRPGSNRSTRQLHTTAGLVSLPFVLMWAATGFYFAFPEPFRSVIGRFSTPSGVTSPRLAMTPAGVETLSWETLVEAARRRHPGAPVARVVLPSDDRSYLLVQFADRRPTPAGNPPLTSVWVDPYTAGTLLRTPGADRTTGDVILSSIRPAHVGSFGGNGIRALWLVIGLVPAFLVGTAVLMWWPRRR